MIWQRRAACIGAPLEAFFPPASPGMRHLYDAVRPICASCPVRVECLDDAMASEDGGARYGYRGGMSPKLRSREARLRRVAA